MRVAMSTQAFAARQYAAASARTRQASDMPFEDMAARIRTRSVRMRMGPLDMSWDSKQVRLEPRERPSGENRFSVAMEADALREAMNVGLPPMPTPSRTHAAASPLPPGPGAMRAGFNAYARAEAHADIPPSGMISLNA